MAGAVAPFRFDVDRRRPLEPHLSRSPAPTAPNSCCAARRSATCSRALTTWVASTASSAGCSQSAVPVAAGARVLRRPVGQRRTVLRDGLRRRSRPPRLGDGRGRAHRRRPAARASESHRRHDGRHPRGRSRRRRPRRRSAATRATSPAS